MVVMGACSFPMHALFQLYGHKTYHWTSEHWTLPGLHQWTANVSTNCFNPIHFSTSVSSITFIIGVLQESATADRSVRENQLRINFWKEDILRTASRCATTTPFASGTLSRNQMTSVSSTTIVWSHLAAKHVPPDLNIAQTGTTEQQKFQKGWNSIEIHSEKYDVIGCLVSGIFQEGTKMPKFGFQSKFFFIFHPKLNSIGGRRKQLC